MTLERRRLLKLGGAALSWSGTTLTALAQSYPTRPVRIVVGNSAGAAPDLFARLTGDWLSQRLGRPFIVENRPGAGGNLGTEAVVRAPADGYTLLMVTVTNAFNAALYENLSFDFIRDIAPVAGVMRGTGVLVVNPSVAARTLPELIAYAKANPGKLAMASGGAGSAQHLYGELFKSMAGVDLLHVPYRGGGPALTDLLGGQVQLMFDTIPSSIEHIRTGRLRALAVTASSRWPALPDVPSVGEIVPGYEASGWIGIGAPKGTSVEIIEKINQEVNGGLSDAGVKATIANLAAVPLPMTPEEFGSHIAAETEKWGKVIRAVKIKA